MLVVLVGVSVLSERRSVLAQEVEVCWCRNSEYFSISGTVLLLCWTHVVLIVVVLDARCADPVALLFMLSTLPRIFL